MLGITAFQVTGKGLWSDYTIMNLQPMEWISTDLAEKVLSNGKKVHFLVIVDRVSGFVKVYQLRSTKTKHIVECLQNFNKIYC